MITGAHDKTIRLWDIRKPATMATLTYHKKSVRALAMHPSECAPPTQSLRAHAQHCLGLRACAGGLMSSRSVISLRHSVAWKPCRHPVAAVHGTWCS